MERFQMNGKVAIITGGAQGFGQEISENLSIQAGLKVVIADLQKDRGTALAREIEGKGGEALFVETDICDVESIDRLMRQTKDRFGQLDVLVNNAKADTKVDFDDVTPSTWNKIMGVTLHGTFFCSKAAIEQMKPVGRGSILNISSISGSLIGGESVPYHTAKAGLNHLTRNLAYHAGPFGIRVNAIAPGLVIKKENLNRYNADTEFKSRWEFCHPLRSHGGSEDICNAILFLASDYAKFITGHVLTIDGGLSLREAGTAVHDFHHASTTSAQTSPSPGAS